MRFFSSIRLGVIMDGIEGSMGIRTRTRTRSMSFEKDLQLAPARYMRTKRRHSPCVGACPKCYTELRDRKLGKGFKRIESKVGKKSYPGLVAGVERNLPKCEQVDVRDDSLSRMNPACATSFNDFFVEEAMHPDDAMLVGVNIVCEEVPRDESGVTTALDAIGGDAISEELLSSRSAPDDRGVEEEHGTGLMDMGSKFVPAERRQPSMNPRPQEVEEGSYSMGQDGFNRERHTYQSTSSRLSKHQELKPGEAPYQNTRLAQSVEANRRSCMSKRLFEVPSATEIEEFFADAEGREQRRFSARYNFDVVNDVPLNGRFQWVALRPC